MIREIAPVALSAVPPAEREPYRTAALVSLLRLHWFIRLRWAFVIGAVVTLLIEAALLRHWVRPTGLLIVIVSTVAINLLWSVASHSLTRGVHAPDANGQTVRHALLFANAQVAVDLLLLTLILRFTGGIESPLAIFYLFHMAIGSLLLSRWHAVLQAVWACFLYASVALSELAGWLTPHYPLLPDLAPSGWYTRVDFVAAALLVFNVGVLGTLYFTLRIAARLDDREARLRRAHEALSQSERAIRDLQRRRSRFMQTAAHQLKGPLAGIQTLVGLIRDDVVPHEGIPPMCEKIARRCRDGIDQVTELLTLARIQEADPRRHGHEPTDLREVIHELSRQFLPQAQAKQIALSCRIPDGDDLRVRVDKSDLSNCLENLIDNGIKYTTGPGEVTVTAGVCDDARGESEPPDAASGTSDRYIWITVRDTGMGIEPGALGTGDASEQVNSIFDAFRRGNNALAARVPGTGLGLSIVREVVEQVGGLIRVHSRPGHGSRFTLLLPAARSAPAAPPVRDTRSSELVIDTAAAPSSPASQGARTEESEHAGSSH